MRRMFAGCGVASRNPLITVRTRVERGALYVEKMKRGWGSVCIRREIAVQSGDGIWRVEYESVGILRLIYIAARAGVSGVWGMLGSSRCHLMEVREGSVAMRVGHSCMHRMSHLSGSVVLSREYSVSGLRRRLSERTRRPAGVVLIEVTSQMVCEASTVG